MEREVGDLDALENSGLTQVKCKSLRQMKVQRLGEKICSAGGQLGLVLDTRKGGRVLLSLPLHRGRGPPVPGPEHRLLLSSDRIH